MIKHIQRFFTKYSKSDKTLATAIKNIGGFKPFNIKVYALAMRHVSMAKTDKKGYKESNERLEYLGDAVLDLIVAEYLFKKFPYKDEGFLTKIRSRIVCRESLNSLTMKIGLNQLIEFEGKRKSDHRAYKSMYGNAMEAFIGAIYLDKGYKFCKKFIIHNIIMQHYDVTEIIKTISNYKSTIIQWTQKNGQSINFEFCKVQDMKKEKQFHVKLTIENKLIAEGFGFNKKKAEQDAARKAYNKIIEEK